MPRHLIAGFLSILVTFGLFYLMQALILGKDMKLGEAGGSMIDFVRLKKDTDLELKKRKMPDKKEPEEPPPPPDLTTLCGVNRKPGSSRWRPLQRRGR